MTNLTGNIPTLSSRLSKVHVLLVDDDTEILQLMRGLLSRLGFSHITTAVDGAEAVAILKNKREWARHEIDIVITDWNMGPVDGLELMRFIRTSPDSPNQYLPIIMLTGRSDRQDVEKARDAGFTEFLVKPFTAKALCERIILCVDQPREFIAIANYTGPSRRRRKEKADLPEGVSEDRRQRETKGAQPGKALKGKIGFDINMKQIFTPAIVSDAQRFIEGHAEHFRTWAMKDVGELYHIIRNAQLLEKPEKYYGRIRRIAFSLKSHAGTFGYDLASRVAKSLMVSVERPLENPKNQLIVLEKHIDTLRIIFADDVRNEANIVGDELLRGLSALIEKYR